MKTKFFPIHLLIFALFSQACFADDLNKAKPQAVYENLSWEQSVDLAIKNNNNLKSALANERVTHYQQNATISAFLPQATATLSSNRGTSGNASNPALTTVQNDITQAYNSSISVSQNLFSGFSDVGKYKQAKANNMVSKASINIVKAQVSYDLKYAYANFTFAKDTLVLLDSIITRRENNLTIIEMRYKSGMENKGSLLLARAYLEQAKYDRLQAANLVATARAQLCRAIGLSTCYEFDVSNTVPITQPKNTDLKMLIETTPQHIQAKAQEEAAMAGIMIAESAFLPSLVVNAATGQRGANYFPQNDYWSVGFNLSLPFFTGGRDYFTMQSAYSSKTAATENRENIDQQVFVSLQQNYNSYIESVAKLKVDEKFKDAATLRADIARNKYNNGLLTFEDWDIIETDLINRQKSYLQSKFNRVSFEAAWEQSQGKGVFYNE